MAAVGAALAVLAFQDVLPSKYAMVYFGCLGMQILVGPWWKNPLVQAGNKPVTFRHIAIIAGLSVVCMAVSAFTESSLWAAPFFALVMEYTYFRWVDRLTLADKVQR